MADPTPEQQQEQYAAIELLYSEGQWSEVLQASEALLAALPPVEGHPLRPRLQLVIGHTLLYGLADLHGAEQHYRSVLLETEEPVLREIAEQGLSRCSEQRQAVIEPAEEAPAAPSDEPAAPAEASPAATAMPWEVDLGTSSGSAPGGASGAVMPWLRELGLEPPTPAAGDGGDSPFLSSVRTARNAETPNLQQGLGAEEGLAEGCTHGEEMGNAVGEATPELVLTPQPQKPQEQDTLLEATPATSAEETLALLREPDALIPVTVQVLEEAQAPAESETPAHQGQQEPLPQPAKEEPPLSPDDMAELARGLLEVVLR